MSIDNKILYIKYFIIGYHEFCRKIIENVSINSNIRLFVLVVIILIFKALSIPIYE